MKGTPGTRRGPESSTPARADQRIGRSADQYQFIDWECDHALHGVPYALLM
jgi:hypothetical protein